MTDREVLPDLLQLPRLSPRPQQLLGQAHQLRPELLGRHLVTDEVVSPLSVQLEVVLGGELVCFPAGQSMCYN